MGVVRIAVFPVALELRWSFFLLLSLMIGSGSGFFAGMSLFFSLFHECAHGLTAHVLGYHPEKIEAGLFGGVLYLREIPDNSLKELMIHLSGPCFNLCCAAALFLWTPSFFSREMEQDIILCNLLLGLFNLVPFYPLDGGKAVCLFLKMYLGRGRALWFSKKFSLIFSFFLFLLGIYLVQYNSMNLLISALAINLYFGAEADYNHALYQQSLAELKKLRAKNGATE